MMDLMILVAVFVAILALAYFTYRNIVGLDTRIRKIEDVLRNAEVVASPQPVQSFPQSQVSQGIPGWGGEGPPEMSVNVERVDADVAEDEEYAGDDEGGDDDEGDDDEGNDDEGNDDEGDDDDEDDDDEGDEEPINNQKTTKSTVRVSDLREALKKAGVSFPNGAKKALLMSLVQENNVELSA